METIVMVIGTIMEKQGGMLKMTKEQTEKKVAELEAEISKLKRKAFMLEAVMDIRKYGFSLSIRNETMNYYNKKYTKLAELLPPEIVEEIKEFVCQKIIEHYELEADLKNDQS